MPLTLEQKALQIYENGVTYGELCMIVLNESWDFTMNDAIEMKWQEMFGKEVYGIAITESHWILPDN